MTIDMSPHSMLTLSFANRPRTVAGLSGTIGTRTAISHTTSAAQGMYLSGEERIQDWLPRIAGGLLQEGSHGTCGANMGAFGSGLVDSCWT